MLYVGTRYHIERKNKVEWKRKGFGIEIVIRNNGYDFFYMCVPVRAHRIYYGYIVMPMTLLSMANDKCGL